MSRPSTDLRAALATRPERFHIPAPLLAARAALSVIPRSSRFHRVSPVQPSSPSETVIARLHNLGLSGMAEAFSHLEGDAHDGLRHADWLMRLLDSEAADRAQRRLRMRLRAARLRYPATLDTVDYRDGRGLDRTEFHKLAAGSWIADGANVIIEGPPGTGKTWLGCALGHKACRDGRTVLYQLISRMFADLELVRGTARHRRLMRHLVGVDLLILDDWGLEPLGGEQRRDMMEIVEERCGRKSTLIISQAPVGRWPELIGEPEFAAVLLDRFVPGAYRLRLTGNSRRGSAN